VRNRQLVSRYLGWDGRVPCSLTEAGAQHQVTRERARQLYAAALPALRRFRAVPALDAVLAFIQQQHHELVSDVEQRLATEGLTEGSISLHGVLRAARVFDRQAGFQLHQIGRAVFVRPVSSQDAQMVLDMAIKRVAHDGATRVLDLCREIAEKRSHPPEERQVRRILQARTDLAWLDEAGEWFWLALAPRNRLLARLRKVLAIQPRIPLSKLHQAISRDHGPLRIPEAILRSVCERIDWCLVGSRHVEARIVPRLEEVLTGGEAIVCAILRDRGGVLPLDELREASFRSGVRKENLWRILSFSPIIERFGKATYGLIGTQVDA